MKTFYPPLSGSCTEKTSVFGGRLGKQPPRSPRWEQPQLCSLPTRCLRPASAHDGQRLGAGQPKPLLWCWDRGCLRAGQGSLVRKRMGQRPKGVRVDLSRGSKVNRVSGVHL